MRPAGAGGYVAPAGDYGATYVGPWRRIAAAGIDWTLCLVAYLLASIPAGVVQSLGWATWHDRDLSGVPGAILLVLAQVLALAPIVAYFAGFLTTGHTLGMRALDIHTVVYRSGRPPGLGRSIMRGLVAFVLGAATYVSFFVAFSDPPLNGYSRLDRALMTAAVVLLIAGGLGKLWLLVDPRRQALTDKLFGLVVIEEIALTDPDPSPWLNWDRNERSGSPSR